MSALDELKEIIETCNSFIDCREESRKKESLFGPMMSSMDKDSFLSQSEFEEAMQVALKGYAEVFNKLRSEFLPNGDVSDDVHPDTSAFMEFMAVEISGQANLAAFLNYTNASHFGVEYELGRIEQVNSSIAATKFFGRCLDETEKFEYGDPETLAINPNGATVAHDIEKRLIAYSALQIGDER